MKKWIVYLILIVVCLIPQNCKSQTEISYTLQVKPTWIKCNVEEGSTIIRPFITVNTELICSADSSDTILTIVDCDGLQNSTKRIVPGMLVSGSELFENEVTISTIITDSTFSVSEAAIASGTDTMIIAHDNTDITLPMSLVLRGTAVSGYGFAYGTVVVSNAVDSVVISLPYEGADSSYVYKGFVTVDTARYGVDTVIGSPFKIPQFKELHKIWITNASADTVEFDSVEVIIFSVQPPNQNNSIDSLTYGYTNYYYTHCILDNRLNFVSSITLSQPFNSLPIMLDNDIQYWGILINKNSSSIVISNKSMIHFLGK